VTAQVKKKQTLELNFKAANVNTYFSSNKTPLSNIKSSYFNTSSSLASSSENEKY